MDLRRVGRDVRSPLRSGEGLVDQDSNVKLRPGIEG